MNQKELTIAIAKRFFLTQRESRELIKFILTKFTEDLKKWKRVSLRGFGSFTKEKRSAKKVRHPETGRIITIPERTTIDFTPSKSLLQNLKREERFNLLDSIRTKLPDIPPKEIEEDITKAVQAVRKKRASRFKNS